LLEEVVMPQSAMSGPAVAVILAGGQGRRLGGLTRQRCKPALPIGGRFRSIDFTLSNCVNSGLRRIGIATQYRSESLIPHIRRHWPAPTDPTSPESIEIWQGDGHCERQYLGTADAVYRNLDAIERHEPRYVLVLAADHVYRMNYAELIEFHHQSGADVTIACQSVPAEQACNFGIVSVAGNEICAFSEKPLSVEGNANVLASMGVYVFDAELLRRILVEDAHRQGSRHDFGRDVIPACVAAPDVCVCAHRFHDPCSGGPGYWSDIGTVDAYWSASMDLLAWDPALDPDDPRWPIRSTVDRGLANRVEQGDCAEVISRSLVADDCRIEGAVIRRSVVSSGVSIGTGSIIEDCILLPGAKVGAHCRLHRVIVDEGISVPHFCALDAKAGSTFEGCEMSPGGVTLVCKTPIVGRLPDRRSEVAVGNSRSQANVPPAGHSGYRSVGT
jgi:glucose-1-phosphate adenylyltransferase